MLERYSIDHAMSDRQIDVHAAPIHVDQNPDARLWERLLENMEDIWIIYSDVDHTNIDQSISSLYDENKVFDISKLTETERAIMDQQANAMVLYGVAHSPMTGKGLNADRYFDALTRVTFTKGVDEGVAEYRVPVNDKDMIGTVLVPKDQLDQYRDKNGLLDMRYIHWKDEYISNINGEKRMLSKNRMPMIMLHTRGNGSLTEDAALIGKSEFINPEKFDLDFYHWVVTYAPLIRASSMQKRIEEVARVHPPYAMENKNLPKLLTEIQGTKNPEHYIKIAKEIAGDVILFDESEGKANLAIDFAKILSDTPEGEQLRYEWQQAWAATGEQTSEIQEQEDVVKAMNAITHGKKFDWMPSIANGYAYFDFAPRGVNKGSRALFLNEYVKNVRRKHGLSDQIRTVGLGDNFSGNDGDFYGAVDYSLTNDPDLAPNKIEMPDLVVLPGENRMDRTLNFWINLNQTHAQKQAA